MKEKIHWFFHHAQSLYEQVYSAILAIGLLAGLVALALTLAQHLGSTALLASCSCLIVFLAFQLLRVRWGTNRTHALILTCILNFLVLPTVFFGFGGIAGGLTMFYLLGLFNVAVLLRGRTRVVTSFLSLGAMLYSLRFSHLHPELRPILTVQQQYTYTKISLFLAGTALVILSVYVLKAYEDERGRNEELMERLKNLSNYDPLTSLYNRRELFRRLELVYRPAGQNRRRDDKLKRDGCYIAMFDVDNFKRLNDTYGHQFGDQVLSSVAGTLKAAIDPAAAEIAARYGGEEFVCILFASDAEEAFRRVDAMRQAVAALAWERVPGLTVTISGGLVSCEEYAELDLAMQNVDKLLYQSKHGGKNRISNRFDSRR